MCPQECSESCFIIFPLPELSFPRELTKNIYKIYIYFLYFIGFPASAAPGAHCFLLNPKRVILFLLGAQICASPAVLGPDLPGASQCPWEMQDSCTARQELLCVCGAGPCCFIHCVLQNILKCSWGFP